ncbi:MAG: DUF4245 domain-containing protein [Microbacteriaceae bacterium]
MSQRPRIVAELGRPETPQETADRRSAASAKRRANQTTLNLVLALVASLAVVAVLILVVVRDDRPLQQPVDYVEIAERAAGTFPAEVVAPDLPEGWSANRAEVAASRAIPTWEIGFLTPDGDYIAFTQAVDADATWVVQQTGTSPQTDEVTLGGATWDEYDRREQRDIGNRAYTLVTESGDSTFLLAGTASDEEFAVLAEAVIDETVGPQ